MDGNGIARPDAGRPACPRRRIAVTGAGGFIGRQVVATLHAAGHRVSAISRQRGCWPDGVEPLDGPAQWAAAASLPHWQRLLAGHDALVHLAAMAHLPIDTAASRRALWQLNVRATDRIAQAAGAAGLRDFVFVSSIKAVGERSAPGVPLTESTPPGELDCYGAAKRIAERRLARRAVADPAMRITMLRPPLVYGPGVGANMAALARLAATGLPLPLAGIDNRRSLIYVGNLADAILTVLARPSVAGGIFHVCDGPAVSTPALVGALAQAQGRRSRLWALPPRMAARLATIPGLDARWSRLAGSLESDDTAFRRQFDWQPPFSLAEGLARQFEPR